MEPERDPMDTIVEKRVQSAAMRTTMETRTCSWRISGRMWTFLLVLWTVVGAATGEVGAEKPARAKREKRQEEVERGEGARRRKSRAATEDGKRWIRNGTDEM